MNLRLNTGIILNIALLFLLSRGFGQEVFINEVFLSPPFEGNASAINTNSLYNADSLEQPPHNMEWIELYNPDPCDSVDISCYTLASNMEPYPGSGYQNWGSFTFPPGSVIPPAGFIIAGGNHSDVPLLDYNIGLYRDSLFNQQYLTGEPTRWFLRNEYGWIALYDPAGVPVNAVYWTQGAGPDDIYLFDEYQHDVISTVTCSGTQILPAAVSIPGIEFAGYPVSDSYLSLQRERDGSLQWKSFPSTPTPRECNSDCVQPPELELTPYYISCFGMKDGKIYLSIIDGGTGPYQIIWNSHPGQTGNSIQNLGPGIYSVTVTDQYGCFIVSDSVEIIEPLPINIQEEVAGDSCGKSIGKIVLNITEGTPPYYYIWSHDSAATGSVVSGLSPGNYTVTVSDINGCFAKKTIPVSELSPEVILEYQAKPDCCAFNNGSAVIIPVNGTEPYNYLWSNGCIDATNHDLPEGNYQVTVTDASLCRAYATIEIPYICREKPPLFVPNTFTPNHDLVNDLFKAYGEHIIEFEMYIFNRFGELVYKTNNPDEGWDGTSGNEPCPSAVYAWYIRYTGDLGKGRIIKDHKSGFVFLLR